MNHTKRALAMTVIAVAALLPRSHFADGNNANDPKPPVTNREILEVVNRLETAIIQLQATVGTAPTVGTPQTPLASKIDALQAVAAKRGVAILQVVPRASGNGHHYHNPRYFVMGSTIQGFHHTVAFGTEITQASTNHTLPAGSYMFELQQPRPPDDDARCAVPQPFRGHPNIAGAIAGELHSVYEDAMIYEPAFGSTTATSTTSTIPSLEFRCRVMRIHSAGGYRKFDSGAAVLKFDGTQGFEVRHKIPASWITAGRSLSSYYGSVRITKLE